MSKMLVIDPLNRLSIDQALEHVYVSWKQEPGELKETYPVQNYNGYIEELHAGRHSDLLENPELSRITDDEMKKLMIESSARMAELLLLKEAEPDKYWKRLEFFHENYCGRWEK